MKLEVQITKYGRKGLARLESKIDRVLCHLEEEDNATQQEINRLASELNASTSKLESSMKRTLKRHAS